MKFPAFDYLRPRSVAEAVDMLGRHAGEARPLAGGQSLLPMLAFRLVAPSALVDLGSIPGLDAIDVAAEETRLGASVRWRDIERDGRLAAAQPLLREAVAHVAHYQVRNRGTVGGSLAHADPAAELPAVALACDALIDAAGPAGERSIPAESFFRGFLSTALAEDEIVVGLRLPAWPAARQWAFREVARRRGDFALAGVALWFDRDGAGRIADLRLVGFGVGDRPLRLRHAEDLLRGRPPEPRGFAEAAAAAAAEVDPPDDPHAGADYRRSLLATLLQRALASAAGLPAEASA